MLDLQWPFIFALYWAIKVLANQDIPWKDSSNVQKGFIPLPLCDDAPFKPSSSTVISLGHADVSKLDFLWIYLEHYDAYLSHPWCRVGPGFHLEPILLGLGLVSLYPISTFLISFFLSAASSYCPSTNKQVYIYSCSVLLTFWSKDSDFFLVIVQSLAFCRHQLYGFILFKQILIRFYEHIKHTH